MERAEGRELRKRQQGNYLAVEGTCGKGVSLFCRNGKVVGKEMQRGSLSLGRGGTWGRSAKRKRKRVWRKGGDGEGTLGGEVGLL